LEAIEGPQDAKHTCADLTELRINILGFGEEDEVVKRKQGSKIGGLSFQFG